MIAADVMTSNPRTIRDTDTIADAVEALQLADVRHLPVVNEQDELIGMLSDRDLGSLMRTFMENGDAERMVPALSQRLVSQMMSADVVCVDLDADVTSIAETMLEQRIGAVPVVDGEGAVVGIVSYVDILRSVVLGEESPEGETPRATARA